MMTITLASTEVSPWVGLFGSFHPGIVHFPIGLLAAAAILETWQILRKKPGLSPATTPLVYLAALAAPPAAFFGFMLANAGKAEGPTVELHKWLGLGSTVIALFAAAVAAKARAHPGALKACRAGILIGTLLVLAAGYFGGEMTMGPKHVLKWVEKILGIKPPGDKTQEGTPTSTSPNGGTPADKVDFVTQVAPILQKSCIKCHNPGKKKGKLLLDTKANAMKGGENGACLVPGQPEKSSFYTLLLSTNDDERMPAESKPLPKDQVELIRKWIEQGAAWPDGATIK